MTIPLPLLALDLDDTLYLERDYVLSGFGAVGAYLRAERNVEGFDEVAVELFRSGMRGRIFDAALPMLGVPPDPALVATLVEIYRAHEPVIALCDDVLPFLAWARPRFTLALLTDGFAQSQRRKIGALRLEGAFDHIVVCDELGASCWKPSHIPFESLTSASGCEAGTSTYVGDNPGKDVRGPRSVGWRSILLRRPDGIHAGTPLVEPLATAVVADLHDARRVLEGWSLDGGGDGRR